MVLFFTSNSVSPPALIYMGKDKVENEDLIKYGFEEDVWFHVDKLSSAHVYLRLPSGKPYGDWDNLPPALVMDAAQLVKANSIEGNKKNNLTIIYTPWSNLKKTGDMAIGQVSFHRNEKVKRVHVPARDNVIVNRLNKTKVEKDVDHEQVRQERLREAGRLKKAEAIENAKLLAQQKKEWADQKKSKRYENLFTEEAFEERARQEDSDDDFM
ncbi:hypothetical protein NliqN6_4869 [Naganishia liquefaciens]|uniref:NFACT RNA-binding domain-containing protein n=1 Tax=Naganishia liquefaciens TaxID=104408 RepID=A0A8H3YHR6_9TREE|nr:hypothetical protein NliqN6_4869 [Naganishia liquefaciens]